MLSWRDSNNTFVIEKSYESKNMPDPKYYITYDDRGTKEIVTDIEAEVKELREEIKELRELIEKLLPPDPWET